ncbi:MAG: metallophosphoesterase [Ignavibacteria bacterium]
MKIAHISDTHICTRHNRRSIKNTGKLLKYILNNDYDHLVITGDITESASSGEFKIMREILADFNLLDSEKLSIVIGNHDIFGGVQLAEEVIHFPAKCKTVNYKEKVKEFREYFHEVFDNVYSPTGNLFPYAKDLGWVVLVGINSISEYSKLKNLFASNGSISSGQMNGLYDIFNSLKYKAKPVFVLLHHQLYKIPFQSSPLHENTLWARVENQTMKLRGRKKFINFLSKYNVKLVLHGHTHESIEYSKNGITCMNGGATFSNYKPDEMKFNSIIIEDESIIKTEIVSFPAEKIIKDNYNSIARIAEIKQFLMN